MRASRFWCVARSVPSLADFVAYENDGTMRSPRVRGGGRSHRYGIVTSVQGQPWSLWDVSTSPPRHLCGIGPTRRHDGNDVQKGPCREEVKGVSSTTLPNNLHQFVRPALARKVH